MLTHPPSVKVSCRHQAELQASTAAYNHAGYISFISMFRKLLSHLVLTGLTVTRDQISGTVQHCSTSVPFYVKDSFDLEHDKERVELESEVPTRTRADSGCGPANMARSVRTIAVETRDPFLLRLTSVLAGTLIYLL